MLNSLLSRAPPLSVGFVLLHRFTLLPFAAFVDCLRLAPDEGDRSRQLRCHWTFMTSTGEPATSSCGAFNTPCQPFRDPASPSEMRKRAADPGSDRVDPFFLHIQEV